MIRSLGLATLLTGLVAAAQDGGIPERAEGCFVAKKLVNYLSTSTTSSVLVNPLWVDSQNRLIALPGSGAPTPMCLPPMGARCGPACR